MRRPALAYDQLMARAVADSGRSPASSLAASWTRTLARDLGPRRPTSTAERVATEWLRERLAEQGVRASAEEFGAYSTFALPQSVILGLAVGAGLLPARFAEARSVMAVLATVLGALEDDPRLRPLGRVLSRRRSQNLVATVEPRGEAERTLCLLSHIDTSRSGLLFHPRVAPRLRGLLTATAAALMAQGLEQVLSRSGAGRRVLVAARSLLAVGLGLLAERELRGQDVPGANDNASGAAVTAALVVGAAVEPLSSTRVVLVVTGAEEAGTLGADAFLRAHDTSGWIFLNFDGVGASATLRFLTEEGIVRTWPADPGLVAVAEALGGRCPELGLEAMEVAAGLTYDATPVLARGGRALTISSQDGTIPHYHQPSDNVDNLDDDTLNRAVEIGRELIAAIDRGEADDDAAAQSPRTRAGLAAVD